MNQPRPLPPEAMQLMRQAMGLFHGGRYADAVQIADRALRLSGPREEVLNFKAMALLEAGRRFEAEATMREALRVNPETPGMHANASRIYSALAWHRESIRHAEEACRRSSRDPNLLYQLAQARREAGQPDRALAVLDRCLQLAPNHGDAWHLRAVIASSLGQQEDATEALERAVAIDRDNGKAWCALVQARGAPDDSALREELERVRDNAPKPIDRASAEFALADIDRKAGRYDAAFDRYRAANAARARMHPFDVGRLQGSVYEVIRRSPPILQAVDRDSGEGGSLVFIIGMPRSGTSLTEQVLAAHPDTVACGELIGMDVIERGWFQAGRNQYRLEGPGALSEDDLALARERYRRGLRPGWETARVVTDKAPLNFLRVGQIHRLFPAARFVYCQRHPLDTILSNYFQNFQKGLNFSFDLDALVEVYIAHQQMMDHWREHLPERIRTQDYRRFVEAQEDESRALADFVGLDFDPAMLTPHTKRRAVGTASNWQVRKPVYRSSIGYWRHYADHIAPQIERLRAAGILDQEGEPLAR